MTRGKSSSRGLKLVVLFAGMVVGAGLIILDQQEFISGFLSVAPPLTGLSILDVPIDPTTGGVLGSIILGAPDLVPQEQTGTIISQDGLNCTEDFGRRLAGARNADPVFWLKRTTGISGQFNCAYTWAQWDISQIPSGFVATGVGFKMELLSASGVTGNTCIISFNDFDVDTVPEVDLAKKLRSEAKWLFEGIPAGLTFLSSKASVTVQDPNGVWCRTIGIKSFNFGQTAVDEVNLALNNGVNKLVLGFTPRNIGNINNANEQYLISNQYWATQGSWVITGSSPPIDCGQGFEQIEFRCVPLLCIQGEAVNSTNQCSPIVCGANEELMADVCVPLQCTSGQTFNNVTNMCENVSCPIGQFSNATNQCQDLVCDTAMGEIVSGNVCELKTCGTGTELVGGSCQIISCPPNTVLSGSNCVEISCATGSSLIDGQCVVGGTVGDVTCPAGFNQVGNSCAIAPESCPVGTIPAENVCIQVLPSLMATGAPELGLPTIAGIAIFAGSFIGLVAVVIRPS
jgi:hypothetical protein